MNAVIKCGLLLTNEIVRSVLSPVARSSRSKLVFEFRNLQQFNNNFRFEKLKTVLV